MVSSDVGEGGIVSAVSGIEGDVGGDVGLKGGTGDGDEIVVGRAGLQAENMTRHRHTHKTFLMFASAQIYEQRQGSVLRESARSLPRFPGAGKRGNGWFLLVPLPGSKGSTRENERKRQLPNGLLRRSATDQLPGGLS